jgi:hypothetical protein
MRCPVAAIWTAASMGFDDRFGAPSPSVQGRERLFSSRGKRPFKTAALIAF